MAHHRGDCQRMSPNPAADNTEQCGDDCDVDPVPCVVEDEYALPQHLDRMGSDLSRALASRPGMAKNGRYQGHDGLVALPPSSASGASAGRTKIPPLITQTTASRAAMPSPEPSSLRDREAILCQGFQIRGQRRPCPRAQ